MLDIARARKLSFTYHAYHEDAFGIYRGSGALPDPARANTPLIDLFTAKLAKAGKPKRQRRAAATVAGTRGCSRPRSASGTACPTGRRR